MVVVLNDGINVVILRHLESTPSIINLVLCRFITRSDQINSCPIRYSRFMMSPVDRVFSANPACPVARCV